MKATISRILKPIKDRTGIDITVCDTNGNVEARTNDSAIVKMIVPQKLTGVTQDLTRQKTYFPLNYLDELYVGVINGSDKIAFNYAYMIADILENSANKEIILSRDEMLKMVVTGEILGSNIQKFMYQYNIPDLDVFILVFSGMNGRSVEIFNYLTQIVTNSLDTPIIMEDTSVVFVKFLDNESFNEYQSSADFASYIVDNIKAETGLMVSVGVGGTVSHLTEINTSYQQAFTALRMGAVFGGRSNVHSYKEFLMVKMFEDIPKAKLSEYFEILLDPGAKTILADEDIINTAEEFLQNSLNVSETSRNLYMHRNTLMYRLDKIERATGLNIRKFSDAVTFRIVTLLYKILK